jgi:hypothetical protein
MDQSKAHSQWAYIETTLNINLNINNKNQDCKIDTVYVRGRGTNGRRDGEGRRLR